MIWPFKQNQSKPITVEGKVQRIGALSSSEFSIAYAVVFEGPKPVRFYVPRQFECYVACSSIGDNLKLTLVPSSFADLDWDLTDVSNDNLGPLDVFQGSFLKP